MQVPSECFENDAKPSTSSHDITYVSLLEMFVNLSPKRLGLVAAFVFATISISVPFVFYTDIVSAPLAVNPLNSSNGEEPNSLALADEQRELLGLCVRLSKNDQSKCLERVILSSVKEGTYSYTRQALDEIELRTGFDFYESCHNAIHEIGKRVLGIYENSGGKAVTKPEAAGIALSELDSSTCGGSMAHGVIEWVSISGMNSAEWGPLMARCAKTMAANPEANLGCGHAIGHGLVVSASIEIDAPIESPFERRFYLHANGRLPDLMARCQELAPEGSKAGHDCAYGVDMQIYGQFAMYNRTIDDKYSIIRACDGLRPDVRKGCAAGAGLSLSVNLGMQTISAVSLSDSLLACFSGPVEKEDDPYSTSTSFACQTEIITSLPRQLAGKSKSIIVSLCSGLERQYGTGSAIRCLLENVGGLPPEQNSAMLAMAGELGTKASEYQMVRDGNGLLKLDEN
jgi:hypothetical protein